MQKDYQEFDFELDLLFEKQKNPVEAFTQIGKFYEKLLSIDQQILYNIYPNAKLEYELIDLEFGSIKSRVNQLIKAIPDEVLKDILDPKALLGHLLIYIKHRLIKATETNEIQSKNQLEIVTRDINKEIKKLSSETVIILEVNNYFVLNAIHDLTLEGRRLRHGESYVYVSENGKATIKNSNSINIKKLLFELGGQTVEQQRVETLKLKSIDLLSERANWRVIRLGKQIEIKITDKPWLENYHKRQIVIQPNDYLKLELKIIYTTNPQNKKPIVYYEAVKIFEVIPPDDIEDDNQIGLFE